MNAIVPSRTSAPILTPTTFEQLVTFADIASSSDFVPKDFRGKPGNIMIACQMGGELGLSPMQSLQSIAVINGRPGIFGDGLIGLCRASPLCEDIIETMEGEGEAREAVCIAKRRGAAPVEARFSVADAKRAQLWGKDIWAKYPDRMLRNRARGYALRDAFPDVLRGLKTTEELIDTPPDDFRGTTIDAKPATNSESRPASGNRTPLQTAQADHHQAQQAGATPPAKKMTISEFLDALDRELALAPEASAVEALLRSKRVTDARDFLTNGAAQRLATWTARAEQKRQALLDDEAEAKIELPSTTPAGAETLHNTTQQGVDPLNAGMPQDIAEWPLVGEAMMNG